MFATASKSLDTRTLGYRVLKRAFDIAFSGCVIAVGAIPCAVLSAAIAADTKGSPIYAQTRVGRYGRPFSIYKFRTMVADADNVEKYLSPEQLRQWQIERKVDNDPRITPLGRVLRTTSIDELPQFFNVLKGDMSLVGPRPEVPHFVEQFKEEIPRYMVKHQVRPGITGWAQVNGLRGDTSIRERIEHDLYYIENWNILFDVKILLMTLFRAVNKEKINL